MAVAKVAIRREIQRGERSIMMASQVACVGQLDRGLESVVEGEPYSVSEMESNPKSEKISWAGSEARKLMNVWAASGLGLSSIAAIG